ncbi:LacI family transcriptional regulator [Jannaschia pagri]|uniref:LacI family transcriptional regulator n=1 Tax=Jannaschia pagri TaxID=2829797 RepID=A0ABQ4NIS4_9RHOB|nr:MULTISPECIES: LacI family DNA-binding transcriptional regulator [unclassified Jannaschia]GIT89581.1 LacI family transcriptional regulator [Jannaschia sp. AI_61]GIT94311.1 LacI family transcriptional regulator [Jannaschia sp. AI_62]
MAKRPNPGLQAIADRVGVSKMTVSRVLRGGGGFSAETEAKVREAADALGYVPNRLAAAFGRSGTSTLVGVCVPRLNSALFGSVLESLNATLARLGYDTMIGAHDHLPSEEEAWIRALAAWKPAAVVLTSREHSARTLSTLRDMSVPVLEMWDLRTAPIDLSVGFSHYDNGWEMARTIANAGRQRIGYIGGLAERQTMGAVRLNGFRKGLDEAGLSVFAEERLTDRPGFYSGYYATEMLLARAPKLDAIYYQDDEMAIGGQAYLTARGIRVPDDIGIAGWGGMEAASILPRRLTTTMVPTTRLGKVAAEALVSRLRDAPVQDVTVVQTRLVPGSTI